LLNYLGNVLVNGPQTPIVTNIPPTEINVEPPETPAGMCKTMTDKKVIHSICKCLLKTIMYFFASPQGDGKYSKYS
jgi:hypothetical protein